MRPITKRGRVTLTKRNTILTQVAISNGKPRLEVSRVVLDAMGWVHGDVVESRIDGDEIRIKRVITKGD